MTAPDEQEFTAAHEWQPWAATSGAGHGELLVGPAQSGWRSRPVITTVSAGSGVTKRPCSPPAAPGAAGTGPEIAGPEEGVPSRRTPRRTGVKRPGNGSVTIEKMTTKPDQVNDL